MYAGQPPLGMEEPLTTDQPFLFLRLPRELRDHIYELCLVAPQHERWHKPLYMLDEPITDENKHELVHQPKVALDICRWWKATLHQDPPLLLVSRQVRTEADEIYWSGNDWLVAIRVNQDKCNRDEQDVHTPIQKWIDAVGLHRLTHLRDLTVEVETCYKRFHYGPERFRVTFDSTDGLRLRSPKFSKFRFPVCEDAIGWHLAITEMRRKQNGWKGEGILELFTGEKEVWAELFCSLPARSCKVKKLEHLYTMAYQRGDDVEMSRLENLLAYDHVQILDGAVEDAGY